MATKSKKNGSTSYWGTAGIFVSGNQQESPESASLYADISRNWAAAKDQSVLDSIMRDKINQIPRILSSSGPVDLNTMMNDLGRNTIASLAQTILDSLRVLQAAEMPVTTITSLSGKTGVFTSGKNLSGGKSSNPIADVEAFLRALEDFNNLFNNLTRKSSQIDPKDWEKVKSRFFLKTKGKGGYGPSQVFYAAAHKILTGSGQPDDYGKIYGMIRGKFGNDIGNMCEGILADVINTPQVYKRVFAHLDDEMGNMAKAVAKSTGKGTASAGTIRFTEDVSFTQTKTNPPPAATQGKRLADNLITLIPTGNGAKVTIGLSIKNLNFHSSFYKSGQIDLAHSLTVGKFAPVFSNISASHLMQRTASKGQYALYGYRALNEHHEPNSPILSYLLAHRVGEIAFGTALDGTYGPDFSPLMSINGKLWNTRDYLLNYGGELYIKTEDFPDSIPTTWWLPEDALAYVSKIHEAKIRVQLRFGRAAALKKFF